MRFGAHLPIMDFGGNPLDLDALTAYARAADRSGFDTLAANDHLVFSVPWLDGPTALASVIEASGAMALATTVALPVVRHPVPVAKALGAIDRLSGGRLVVGVGPGSSTRDHEIVGLDFDERWRRLDEAVVALRHLWGGAAPTRPPSFYDTTGIDLRPRPTHAGGPPIWIGSWGSEAGLRRAARLGDGWLASAYNTTPEDFGRAHRRLGELLEARGRDPEGFPNALSTLWFHLTDDPAEAERVLEDRLVPTVARPREVLAQRLAVGSPERCLELLGAFADAGLDQVLVWPVTDEVDQLERFAATVAPALADA